MICNKCGKNNPAGAEKCSVCKEPMPPLTNCGGFSDILSYNAPPAADVAPAVPVIPVSEPVRQVAEPSAPEPWYKELLTKKNIIILSAIAACFIAIIVIVCVIAFSGSENTDNESKPEEKTEQTDNQSKGKDKEPDKFSSSEPGNSNKNVKENLFLYSIEIKDAKIDGKSIGLEFEDGRAEFSLVAAKENDDEIVFYCNDDPEPQTEIELEKGESYTIRFHATQDQFPIEIKGSKSVDGAIYHFPRPEDGNNVKWEMEEEEEKGSNGPFYNTTQNHRAELEKETDWAKDVQNLPELSNNQKAYYFDIRGNSFPEGANEAKIVVYKQIQADNERTKIVSDANIFVICKEQSSRKVISEKEYYKKDDIENCLGIIVYANPTEDLDIAWEYEER